MSSGYRAWLAHTGRGLHSPRTGRLDSNVITRTFRADRNALSQKTRQYQSHFERSTLDEDDVVALKFLAFLVSVAPPRDVFFGRSCRPPSHIYSDASHTEGVRTRLGWVLFTNNVTTPMGYWYDIPASLLQDWELTHPIMAVEAFAVLTAIWQHRDLLTGMSFSL